VAERRNAGHPTHLQNSEEAPVVVDRFGTSLPVVILPFAIGRHPDAESLQSLGATPVPRRSGQVRCWQEPAGLKDPVFPRVPADPVKPTFVVDISAS
jgi:hypothetical protein